MAYDKNTKTLRKLPSDGITIKQIAACLEDYRVVKINGKNYFNLGLLCTSPKINHWSAHKPIRHHTLDALTENDIKNANYGFGAMDNADAGFNNNYVWKMTPNRGGNASGLSVVEMAKADPTWKGMYQRPRGLALNEPFRQIDFDGYNHKAVIPYSSERSSYSFSVLTEQAANRDIQTINIRYNRDAEISLRDFQGLIDENRSKTLMVGIAYFRTSDENKLVSLLYSSSRFFDEQLAESSGFFEMDIDVSVLGTTGQNYEACWIVGNLDPDTSEGMLFYLPNSYFTMNRSAYNNTIVITTANPMHGSPLHVEYANPEVENPEVSSIRLDLHAYCNFTEEISRTVVLTTYEYDNVLNSRAAQTTITLSPTNQEMDFSLISDNMSVFTRNELSISVMILPTPYSTDGLYLNIKNGGYSTSPLKYTLNELLEYYDSIINP